jgi:hypothetical protein
MKSGLDVRNKRRKSLPAVLMFLAWTAALPCFAQENNDFYDNTPARDLSGPRRIEITGEIANPGPVEWTGLPVRSQIVRETRVVDGENRFLGSYRYDGYSLFDILKEKYVRKNNREEFKSVIDLMVSVENRQGERVVLSWGEIFYPTHLHRIMIATRVAPIIPTLTGEEWPLPEETRLIVTGDLATVRNITAPSKITVFSSPLSFKRKAAPEALYSPVMSVFDGVGKKKQALESLPENLPLLDYPAVFYGRGKGFHGIQNFHGRSLREILKPLFPVSESSLKRGYFIVAALDGYRIAVSCSELFNRNDFVEFLIVDRGPDSSGGRFSLFPAPDFFSDRAVKSISDIHFQSVPD